MLWVMSVNKGILREMHTLRRVVEFLNLHHFFVALVQIYFHSLFSNVGPKT